MSPAQFRAAIARLGLSQEAAGVFMGRSPRQGQRWANGDPIPGSVVMLLRLMIDLNLTPEVVRTKFSARAGRAGRASAAA